MVSLKRIKNKDDLRDVLAYLIEDISTYKFLKTSDVNELLSKAYDKLED